MKSVLWLSKYVGLVSSTVVSHLRADFERLCIDTTNALNADDFTEKILLPVLFRVAEVMLAMH